MHADIWDMLRVWKNSNNFNRDWQEKQKKGKKAKQTLNVTISRQQPKMIKPKSTENDISTYTCIHTLCLKKPLLFTFLITQRKLNQF